MKNEAIPFGNITMCSQFNSQRKNEKVFFNLDTGCTRSLIPLEIAQACHLKIENVIKGNIKVIDIQGKEIEIRGKTTAQVTLDGLDQKFQIGALIVDSLNSSEVMVDRQTIIN